MDTGKANSIVANDEAIDVAGIEGAGTPKDKDKIEKKQTDIEIGGPSGPEPTRYGDWEKGGRCTDF